MLDLPDAQLAPLSTLQKFKHGPSRSNFNLLQRLLFQREDEEVLARKEELASLLAGAMALEGRATFCLNNI